MKRAVDEPLGNRHRTVSGARGRRKQRFGPMAPRQWGLRAQWAMFLFLTLGTFAYSPILGAPIADADERPILHRCRFRFGRDAA